MEPEIMKLANTILVNPSKVKVTPVSSAATSIEQFVYFIDRGNKNDLLLEVLKNEDIKSCLVFTRTKHSADKVVRMLGTNKIRCDAIHGNKSQNARQEALVNFRNKQIRVLVATDIAARGIDIDHLEYVVNYEVPNVAETYVHRIGRTGRAGRNGTAISFCDAEEKSYLRAIERLITKKINIIDQHPFPLIDNNPPKTVQNRQPNKEQGQGQRRGGGNSTSNGNGRSANRGTGSSSNGGGGNSRSAGSFSNGGGSSTTGNRSTNNSFGGSGGGNSRTTGSFSNGSGSSTAGNRNASNSFGGGKDSRASAEDKKHSGKTSPQNRNTHSRSSNNTKNTQASPSSPMSRSNRPMTRSKDSSRTSN
jgi:ATP-dependent RNA helicase RhlE